MCFNHKFPALLFVFLVLFLLPHGLLLANLDIISEGAWLRLGIEKEGVYALTAADLERTGMFIPPDKINTIKLYGQSGQPMNTAIQPDISMLEQPIIVNTNADGSLRNIVFYGSGASGVYMGSIRRVNKEFPLQRHYTNPMDTKNYYLLTYGQTPGKRHTAQSSPTGSEPIRPTSYKATIYKEHDKFMSQSPGSGVLWLGDNVNNDVLVDNLVNYNHSSDVEYVISAGHTATTAATMSAWQNKHQIGEVPMLAISSGGGYASAVILTFYGTAPASTISNNQSFLKLDYSGLAVYPYHNFYEIHYPSDLVPINNQITLFSDIAKFDTDSALVEYVISGFNGTIYGFDVTDMSSPKLLQNVSNTSSSFVFRANELAGLANIKKYFVSASLQTPPVIENISMLNLRDVNSSQYSNVDMILITPDEFIESAKRYAEYREKQSGLRVSVVPINKIYAEFSYTRLDLSAIRNYIQYTYQNWETPPQYVFLWGTGHYDYRGIEGHPNYIPAWQAQNSNIINLRGEGVTSFVSAGVGSYTTDDFYVNVDATDRFQDIAIGRLPISNNQQGYDYIHKLDLYENHSGSGSWRRNFLIHADDGSTVDNGVGDGVEHSNNGEKIAAVIPQNIYKNKVYIVDYPVEYQTGGARIIPKAAEELMKQLNLVGNVAYFYTGHGSRNTLTHEKTFTIDMLSQLNNSDKLFFFGAFACEVARFDNHVGCLAGDIVLLPNTGGIASYAASRVSVGYFNTNVAVNLTRHLFDKNKNNEYNSIGEASRLAKFGDTQAEAFMYILMGDPSLKLVFPNLNIHLAEVNGVDVTSQTDAIPVKGLASLKLAGSIVDDAGRTVTDFNGSVNIAINEPNIPATVYDPNGTKFNFIKNGAMLSSGVYRVTGGQFEAEIMVPGDISFSSDKSIIYMYAVDSTGRYANGDFDNIIINDIDASVPIVTAGPTITIAMDSKLFKSGDVVARNPLLLVHIWDTTAINATGLGIGHKLEARIDNGSDVIDLTSNFSPSFTDPNAGDVQQYLYGLEPGYHTITVRAWNIFNNYSESTVGFIIPTDKEEGVLSAAFTPNPAVSNEQPGIAIYYTVTPPINAEIRVFDAGGREVINTTTTLTTNGYALIDSRTLGSEAALPPGNYYYYIRFEYDQTRTTYRSCEKFGGLGVIVK